MSNQISVLILGASYGSLLGTKLAAGGAAVKLVCLPAEVALINSEGARIRMPVRGREGLVEIDSRKLSGSLSAAGPDAVNPADYQLVVLAMQEPQYRSPGVRELTAKVAQAKVPCMSIMNMPPLTYLGRIAKVPHAAVRPAYTDPTIWDAFDSKLMTLCSPDAQAFRPPEEKINVLQVRLPTNFRSARFESDAHTAILRQLEADVDAARFDDGAKKIELPVKLRVHESVFVPLAKWCMLLAGNYRCVGEDGMRPIREAVHANIAESRAMYDWVFELCCSLGAVPADLVPFDKYAEAAQMLGSPSSAARALAAGAPNIERVDRLVQIIAAQQSKKNPALDRIVALVDKWLEKNRAAAAAKA